MTEPELWQHKVLIHTLKCHRSKFNDRNMALGLKVNFLPSEARERKGYDVYTLYSAIAEITKDTWRIRNPMMVSYLDEISSVRR